MKLIYKPFRRIMVLARLCNRSLLQRVILGQFLILIFFCTVVSANLLWEFTKTDSGELDKSLSVTARAIVGALQANAITPQQRQELLSSSDYLIRQSMVISKNDDGMNPDLFDFVSRVMDAEGREIYRTTPYPAALLDISEPGSRSVTDAGRKWRMHTYRAPGSGLTVQVAQTTASVDTDLWSYITRFILVPLLWFMPLAALVTYFVTIKGLQPLRDLATAIARRHPNDMRPLVNVASYLETQSVVGEINSLLKKLETTLQRERNFLADAAHELRTPLAVVQAQAHVLRQADTEAAKTLASDALNSGVERAASLVQKLLLTARVSVDNFEPRFEAIDLVSFVQERMAAFAGLAACKNIEIELNGPRSCSVMADRETFISALDNVLDNAIRYTPEGGEIRVRVIPDAVAGKVCLRVEDNGIGIPIELHERVLERFFRVAGTEQQGSGLGLAIVKRVLALHGGDVTLSQGLGRRGLSVDLTIPVRA
jgi:signal transduction histidine kinase